MDPGLYELIDGRPDSLEDARIRVHRWITGSPDPSTSWINHVARARDDQRLIGVAQATVLLGEPAAKECMIAYLVVPAEHGKGFGKEMMVGFHAELVNHLHPEIFVAHIVSGHKASESIASSLGLGVTGQEVDGERVWSSVQRGRDL
jgi:RimJ/RimL family protein N-acetyltransferase